MTKVTTNTLASSTFNADEAGMFLPLAAKAAIEGKATVDQGKAKGAAALAVMVAGFASDEVASRQWSFDIKVKDAVHTHVDCIGWVEFGNDDLSWKRNGEGAVSRDAQGAYKAALQCEFFNMPNPVAAVWTMASKAIPIARAIRAEGMTAIIENGTLKLSGGHSDRAKALSEAKSLSALTTLTKEAAGTNRAGHGNAKGGEAGEARAATPSEILAAAARLIEGAAKGDEALCNAALSYARKIAKLVAANPEAFAEA